MKYAFIDQHRGEFSVLRMARVLGVTRSGYYAWAASADRRRERSARIADFDRRVAEAHHRSKARD